MLPSCVEVTIQTRSGRGNQPCAPVASRWSVIVHSDWDALIEARLDPDEGAFTATDGRDECKHELRRANEILKSSQKSSARFRPANNCAFGLVAIVTRGVG